MTSPRRSILRILTGASIASALVVTGLSAVPAAGVNLKTYCGAMLDTTKAAQVDLSDLATTNTIVFRGKPVSVAPGAPWLDLYPGERFWTAYFAWMEWLGPIAVVDMPKAVEIFLDRAAAVPDPGASVGPNELIRQGWDESSITKRLRISACLWQQTGDTRLLAPIEELADASMDPQRYYGLPAKRPHNHGLMANVALYKIGRLMVRPEWQAYALARAQADGSRVFDRCGLTLEQSIAYQRTNMRMWANSARHLGVEIIPASTFALGTRSLAALARPDGVLESVGDGGTGLAVTPSGAALWCPKSGFAARTTTTDHFILRGGPRQWAHGHEDHGSMTWFSSGVPVLSDRGRAAKTDSVALAWSRSMLAHSTFEPLGQTKSGYTRMQVVGPLRYRLTDTPGGSTRARDITFTARQISVTDTAAVPVADPLTPWTWVQHWQLAPGWVPDATGATYTDGTRLDIVCSAGALTATAVTSYINESTPEAAWDVSCSATGTSVSVTTTLMVTPPPPV